MASAPRIGIIGGGQLAWMLAAAARQLGFSLAVQTPNARDPAVSVADAAILAPIEDVAATAQLAEGCDWLSFENEFVDLAGLQGLAARGIEFRPSLTAIAPLLDKYHQRGYLRDLGLPVPDFCLWHDWAATPPFGFPVVLKARRHGYDGQGTFILRDPASLAAWGDRLGQPELLLEAFVPFERELAVMAARGVGGEIAIYPTVETQQEQQVCRRVFVPAPLSVAQQQEIAAIARALLVGLDYVGILGIELFCTASGRLLVNEVAPRTHNSGHCTLDTCATSQFAMQLQAVAGRPLPAVQVLQPNAVMVNLLGYEQIHSDYAAERAQLAALPGARVYWYGKPEARPGRKLGHVTVCLPQADRALAQQQANVVEALWQRQAS